MPISQKQLEANRANAQKSTGPRTPEGKRRSSVNATKHGLYSSASLIDAPHLKEDPQKYQRLLKALREELKPHGAFETQLVQTIANCIWRQIRAMSAEVAETNKEIARLDRIGPPTCLNDLDHSDVNGENTARILHATANSIPRDSFSLELLRYELRVDNRLSRTYRLLHQIQQRRRSAKKKLNMGFEPISKFTKRLLQNGINKNGHSFV